MTKKCRTIAIYTRERDLHGHAVAEQIRQKGHHCHIVCTDKLAMDPSLSWYNDSRHSSLTTYDGKNLELSKVDAHWLRRIRIQSNTFEGMSQDAKTLIPTEIQAALYGSLLSIPKANLFNSPSAEIAADNKLVQLRIAQSVGLSVPATLVSSRPNDIRVFAKEHDGEIIVKAVRGTGLFSIPTRKVSKDDLNDDASLSVCPAIWQSSVNGSQHLRIHVFGKKILTASVRAKDLDWRPDLNVPITRHELPINLKEQILALMQCLKLRMGIIDGKVDQDGRFHFFEVNPQGQFLFIEALCGLELSAAVADMLIESSLPA